MARQHRQRNIKVTASCTDCLAEKVISQDSLNVNIKRNGVYRCWSCGMKKARAAGGFVISAEQRSATSKKLWQNQEFRDKITVTSTVANSTEEHRQRAKDRTNKLWEDEEYQKRVSAGVTKKFIDDPAYRERVSNGLRRRYIDQEFRDKMAVVRANNPRISSLQIQLYNYLDDLGVIYHKEGVATAIGHYCFDCLVPREQPNKLLPLNVLIECQGEYWHSLPGGKRNDRVKFTYIDRYFKNYEIVYVWEHEFSTKNRVLDRLRLKFGLSIETTDFDLNDIQIKSINSTEAQTFLNSYHYLVSRRGGQYFGGYYKNQLVACCVFSAPLRQNQKHQFGGDFVEISRFCIHPMFHKKNFASWFLSRLLPKFTVPIVAYADKTIGHLGTIYKATNFKLHHIVEPDFWYVDKDGYVMHKRTLYGKATQIKMKENAYATKHGYTKVFGGHKTCWLYTMR